MSEQATKKCKYCQTEIDAKAKICPNCRKKQRGKGGIIVAIILLIIIVCIIAAMCSSGGNTTTTTNTDTSTTTSTATDTSYAIGDTWTVDGQWEFTVTSVTETSYRNEFSDKNPAAVYIIEYTYTNLGYESDFMDGIYFDPSTETIVDSAGTMGYSYPAVLTNYAQATPVGATCNAEAAIGVDNAGDFKLTFNKYDGDGKKQSATFNLTVN